MSNKITIIGNLGGDAEVKSVKDTIALSFSVADTIGFGDKKTTQWIRCTLWGKRAEGKLQEFLKKGAQVVVFGELELRKYEDKNGAMQSTLECRVDDIKLVGKNETGSSASKPATKKSPEQQSFNDDIPF